MRLLLVTSIINHKTKRQSITKTFVSSHRKAYFYTVTKILKKTVNIPNYYYKYYQQCLILSLLTNPQQHHLEITQFAQHRHLSLLLSAGITRQRTTKRQAITSKASSCLHAAHLRTRDRGPRNRSDVSRANNHRMNSREIRRSHLCDGRRLGERWRAGGRANLSHRQSARYCQPPPMAAGSPPAALRTPLRTHNLQTGTLSSLLFIFISLIRGFLPGALWIWRDGQRFGANLCVELRSKLPAVFAQIQRLKIAGGRGFHSIENVDDGKRLIFAGKSIFCL